MEMIRRKIKLFFVSYGKLFAFIIGVVCITIFVVQSLNSMVIKQNTNKYSDEVYQATLKTQQENSKDREFISQFINYCNEQKIEEAYNMLSNNCKKEKYNTIEEFKEKYVNTVFNISICKHNLKKENNIYIITLTHDAIATGKKDSTLETRLKLDGVLERSIYIIN